MIGFLSDLHSNLDALEAVLKDMEKRKVEKVVCLGDLVGYGPEPEATIRRIREAADVVLLGNHDAMALSDDECEHFNSHARLAMEWTRGQLGEESRAWMAQLPYLYREEGWLCVHASPRAPADWNYVSSLDDAVEAFDFFGEPFCFIGHTHRPLITLQEGRQNYRVLDMNDWRLRPGQRLLGNVGSVGQPRDLDNRAAWMLFDPKAGAVTIRRVDYDYGLTQRKMVRAGLPDFLVHRLSRGV